MINRRELAAGMAAAAAGLTALPRQTEAEAIPIEQPDTPPTAVPGTHPKKASALANT